MEITLIPHTSSIHCYQSKRFHSLSFQNKLTIFLRIYHNFQLSEKISTCIQDKFSYMFQPDLEMFYISSTQFCSHHLTHCILINSSTINTTIQLYDVNVNFITLKVYTLYEWTAFACEFGKPFVFTMLYHRASKAFIFSDACCTVRRHGQQ